MKYKLLLLLSRAIRVLSVLWLMGLFSGIAKERKEFVALVFSEKGASALAFFFLCGAIPAVIYFVLNNRVEPKLKARINPHKEVIEN